MGGVGHLDKHAEMFGSFKRYTENHVSPHSVHTLYNHMYVYIVHHKSKGCETTCENIIIIAIYHLGTDWSDMITILSVKSM